MNLTPLQLLESNLKEITQKDELKEPLTLWKTATYGLLHLMHDIEQDFNTCQQARQTVFNYIFPYFIDITSLLGT